MKSGRKQHQSIQDCVSASLIGSQAGRPVETSTPKTVTKAVINNVATDISSESRLEMLVEFQMHLRADM